MIRKFSLNHRHFISTEVNEKRDKAALKQLRAHLITMPENIYPFL